jgi:tetratricopeptide (TPR) repeat protein
MPLRPDEPPRTKLSTWKDIGAYLGRDERTVKRWERRRGLPVHRAPGGGKSTVFAYVQEIDAWLAAPPSPELAEDAIEGEPVRTAPAAIVAKERDLVLPNPASPGRPLRWGAALLAVVVAAVTVGAVSMASVRRADQVELDAPQLYKDGLYAWHTRTAAGIAEAIADFSQTIKTHPRYAPAYAGLADCYILSPEFGGAPAPQAYLAARTAAERAIALDDRLPQAHRALAFVRFWWMHDVAGSRREFERALALDPGSAQTHHWYATTLSMTGDLAQSIREIDIAESLDPVTTAIKTDKGMLLFHAGRPDEAIAVLRQVETAEPAVRPAHTYLAEIYATTGDAARALRERRTLAELSGAAPDRMLADADAEGFARGGLGGMQAAEALTGETLYEQGRFTAFELAQAYSSVGNANQTFRLLRQSLANHEAAIMAARAAPTLRRFRDDPRYTALLRELSLPPLAREGGADNGT